MYECGVHTLKITHVKMERYRSLRDIELKDIGNYVVLVGKNSSGKSNIIEALWLFFKDLDLSPTQAVGVPLDANAFLWYEGNTEQPIDYRMTLELSNEEARRIYSGKKLPSEPKVELKIHRQIVASAPNFTWKTLEVVWNGTPLIREGEDALEGAAAGFVEDIAASQPPKDKEERKEGTELTKAQVKEILKSITDHLKNKFGLIMTGRGAPSSPPNYAIRTPMNDMETLSKITQLGQDPRPGVRRRWRELEEDFERFSPYRQRLSVIQNQPTVDERIFSVPLYLTGGGTQETITLITRIREDNKPIVALEEPENHLHPELTKKMLTYLRKLSDKKQLWIATHSPFFLRRDDIEDIYLVKKEDYETTIQRLSEVQELKNALQEIGVRPSDLLFSDAILLVEGYTEEDVVPIWADKVGVDFEKNGVAVISIRGAEKGRYSLPMWREITRSAQIPIFLMLDGHAKKEVQMLIDKGDIAPNHCLVLSEHSIEDCYPDDAIVTAAKNLWGLDIDRSKLKIPKEDSIRNLLLSKTIIESDKENRWKPQLGREVAKEMNREQIPEQVRALLERIRLTLEI